MEQITGKHEHITDEEISWPGSLKTAAEISEQLLISEERILELTESNHCPHWMIDDKGPWFQLKEVKQWATKNLLRRSAPADLPLKIQLFIDAPPADTSAPLSIRGILNLREIPLGGYLVGVYFLVKDDEIIYVGQSRTVLTRIHTHKADKDFDSAYLLPTPGYMLDMVEGALIRHLSPRLNDMAPKGKKSDDKRVINKIFA